MFQNVAYRPSVYKTGETRKETRKILFTHFKLKLVVQVELTYIFIQKLKISWIRGKCLTVDNNTSELWINVSTSFNMYHYCRNFQILSKYYENICHSLEILFNTLMKVFDWLEIHIIVKSYHIFKPEIFTWIWP